MDAKLWLAMVILAIVLWISMCQDEGVRDGHIKVPSKPGISMFLENK
jgi:hypothetical protein